MSGAEFVAVLSIGASVIAVVDACNQLRNRVREYEDDDTLRELAAKLQLFSNGIESLQRPHANDDLDPETHDALVELLGCCERRVKELDGLISSALPTVKPTGMKRVRHTIRYLRNDRRVKDILDALQQNQHALVFHLALVSRRTQLDLRGKCDGQPAAPGAADAAGNAVIKDTAVTSYPFRVTKVSRYDRSGLSRFTPSCSLGKCGCPCHQNTIRFLGIVSFNLPSPSPAKCKCINTTFGVSFTAMQKILSFNLALTWTSGLTIDGSLKFTNTVPYTSPGMNALNLFYGGVKSPAETINTLLCLRNNKKLDFDDVTIDNEGYLERTLSRFVIKTGPTKTEDWLEIIKFLAEEGVQWKDPRPLRRCFLAIEFNDMSDFQSTFIACLPTMECHAEQFQSSTYGLMASRRRRLDPFYLNEVFELATYDNLYGEIPALHNAIMKGSLDEVQSLVERNKAPGSHGVDFFGHHALHIAVKRPEILRFLLHHGFRIEIEAEGFCRNTPLMYAAAYEFAQSAKLLMDYGADPLRQIEFDGHYYDSLEHTMSYSIRNGDFAPFREILDHYLSSSYQRQKQETVDRCMRNLLFRNPHVSVFERNQEVAAKKLLSLLIEAGANLDQVFANGDTLLHEVRSVPAAEVLFLKPNNVINKQNVRGYSPLMVLARLGNHRLIQTALSAGADVRLKDHRNMSALHHVLERLLDSFRNEHGPEELSAIASAITLVNAGINLLDGDSCRCHCSPLGCTPLHHFIQRRSSGIFAEERLLFCIPLLMEFSILMKHCGVGCVRQDIIKILSRQKMFERLEMTHTCCLRTRNHYRYDLSFRKGARAPANLAEFYEDMAEIGEEEEELAAELDRGLRDFDSTLQGSDDSQFIRRLADIAVETEEMLAHRQPGIRLPFVESIKKRKEQFTILNGDPVVYIDNSNGFVYGHKSIQHSQPCKSFSEIVNSYLKTTRKHPDYLKDAIARPYDPAALAAERESLAKELLEEVERIRALKQSGVDSVEENVGQE